jgi:hypothetical protein
MAYEKKYVTQPTISEYKGFKTLSIPVGKDGEAFSFGALKAKAIVKYFAEIAQFVKESDAEYESKKAKE